MKSLQDITTRIGDGLHGTPKYDDSGDYYFINGNNLSQDKITLKKETRRVSKEEYLKHKKDLNERTLLVSINGTLGNFAFYNNEKVMLGKSACYLNLIDDVNKEYIGYLLKNRHFQKYIDSNATGTTIKNVSLQTIRSYEFELPPKKNQQDVSNFLSSFDRKIELNQRMNETLEEVAKTLFKSWFIDFDPVRAKAEGRPTGLSKEISDLFPDAFEDSQLGEIPKGWQVYNLESVFDFLEGPGIRNWQYTDEENGVNFINIRCIQNGDLDLSSASKITEDEAYGKYSHFQLMPDDMVVSCSGTLGKFAFVRNSHIPLNLNTSVIRFRPKRELTNINFLEGFIKTQLQRELEIRATGSVQRNFGPTHLKEIEMIVPKKEIMNLFGEILHPLLRKRILNLDQNDILIGLRDTLLPKLISGELKITDAEKFIDEAGI